MSGTVGIGKNAPSFLLRVEGANQIKRVIANRIVSSVDTTTATAGTGAGLALGGYINGTSGGITDLNVIQGIKENGTAGNYASALTFHTLSSTNQRPLNRCGLQSDGNVGIGTNSASQLRRC